MDLSFLSFIGAKPVIVGIHLVFAILGIDAFLWVMGEIVANAKHRIRMQIAAAVGVVSFVLTWVTGGYYYVVFYGSIVKPGIKEGVAPWAHSIVMETKEHVFLFIVPLALTVFFLTLINEEEFNKHNLRRATLWLTGTVVFLGLLMGAMGFIISAAARWG